MGAGRGVVVDFVRFLSGLMVMGTSGSVRRGGIAQRFSFGSMIGGVVVVLMEPAPSDRVVRAWASLLLR